MSSRAFSYNITGSGGGGGGTTPAAPDTSIQFNNGGSFGGSSDLTWDGSTLGLNGSISAIGDINAANIGGATIGGTTVLVGDTPGRITGSSGIMSFQGDGSTESMSMGATGYGNAVILNNLVEISSGNLLLAPAPGDITVPPGYTRISINAAGNIQVGLSSGPVVPFYTSVSPGTAGLIPFTDTTDNLISDTSLNYTATILHAPTFTATNGGSGFIGEGSGLTNLTITNIFDQSLNTTDSVTFSGVNITNQIFINGDNGVTGQIIESYDSGIPAWTNILHANNGTSALNFTDRTLIGNDGTTVAATWASGLIVADGSTITNITGTNIPTLNDGSAGFVFQAQFLKGAAMASLWGQVAADSVWKPNTDEKTASNNETNYFDNSGFHGDGSNLTGIETLHDSTNILSVDGNLRQLIASDGTTVVADWASSLLKNGSNTRYDWNVGSFYDNSATPSLNPVSRFTLDSTNAQSMNWDTRILTDLSITTSLDWQNRILADSDGNGVLGWAGTQLLGFFTAFNTPVAQQTGDIGTGLVSLGLFSGTPTFDGTNLTGVVSLANGGNGIVADADLTAQTTAQTICTITSPNDGNPHRYRIGGYVTITAVATDVAQLQVVYTDETSTVRTQTFFPQGLTSANLAATGTFIFPTMDIPVLANTAITLRVALTVSIGSITYDAGGSIQQLK